jgi:hypothetical protein
MGQQHCREAGLEHSYRDKISQWWFAIDKLLHLYWKKWASSTVVGQDGSTQRCVCCYTSAAAVLSQSQEDGFLTLVMQSQLVTRVTGHASPLIKSSLFSAVPHNDHLCDGTFATLPGQTPLQPPLCPHPHGPSHTPSS